MGALKMMSTLGIDGTVIYQAVIFLITYTVLHYILFKPYYEAYVERLNCTEGNQQKSESVLIEADALKVKYENKARSLNQDFKDIYDKSREQALSEYDAQVKSARTKADEFLKSTRTKIGQEIAGAEKAIKAEMPEITQNIVTKMLQ